MPMTHGPGRPTVTTDRKAALEALGVEALTFLAADQERLRDFIGASGIDPGDLRAAAGQPGFFRGVLSHVANDDALLVAFAASRGDRPERVGGAIANCLHGDEWRST